MEYYSNRKDLRNTSTLSFYCRIMAAKTQKKLYVGQDVKDMGGIKFGNVKIGPANGKNHVHVNLEPVDKNVNAELWTTVTLPRTNPMAYARLIEHLNAEGVLSPEQYNKYKNGVLDKKKNFTASPWHVIPGNKDGLIMKINMGETAEAGASSCEQTIHAMALMNLVDALYEEICNMVDEREDLKAEWLAGSGVRGVQLTELRAKPARSLIKHPIEYPYYKQPTEVNGVKKTITDQIENEPGVFTLKPITSEVTQGKTEKSSAGSFRYSSQGPGGPLDTIWWTTTEYVVPGNKEKGTLPSMAVAQSIEEVAQFMYVSEENRAKNPKLVVENKTLFQLDMDFTVQLPTLYFCEGRGHLIWKTFKTAIIKKRMIKRRQEDPAAKAYYLEQAAESEEEDDNHNDGDFGDLSHTVSNALVSVVTDDVVMCGDDTSLTTVATSPKPAFKTNTMVVYPKSKNSSTAPPVEEKDPKALGVDEEGSTKKRKDHPTSEKNKSSGGHQSKKNKG